MKQRRVIIIALGVLLLVAAAALLWAAGRGDVTASDRVAIGEARTGRVTVALPRAISGIKITEARVPGRPIVLIDAGHGGRDPGATSVSGRHMERDLALAFAIELRDVLAANGRVRVALTREDDRYLTLDERAAIARDLGAALFVSLHMDSAPNPLARGVTVYSLSDVASSEEAARFAASENRAGGVTGESDGSVRALLADVALREQMEDSAALATRLVRRAAGPVLLRPRPHQFAAFHVLRRAAVPAVLVEAGYISNVDDEALLATTAGRAPLVRALARAIEADIAARANR